MGNVHPKVAAAGTGGAISVVIIWAFSLAGVTVPGEVGAAIATIIAFVAGYVKSP